MFGLWMVVRKTRRGRRQQVEEVPTDIRQEDGDFVALVSHFLGLPRANFCKDQNDFPQLSRPLFRHPLTRRHM